MGRVHFLSRGEAAVLEPRSGAVLISIHDVTQEPLVPMPGWSDVLHVCFADVDTADRGLELFGAAHARAILAFIEQHRDCSEMVVHCAAGYSRSAAVALFCSEYLQVPCYKASLPVDARNWALFNRRVLRTLEEEAYGRGSAFGAIED
jgi:predicted protein tyrosine phosphatase